MEIVSKDNSNWPQQRVWQFRGLSGGVLGFIPFRSDNDYAGGDDYIMLAGNIVIEVGTWHYVSVTWDGNVVKLFVDGQLDTEAEYIGHLQQGQTNNVYIGKSETSADLRFDGLIDEVSIYNRALTAVEVSSLYTTPYAMFTRPTAAAFFGVSGAPPAVVPTPYYYMGENKNPLKLATIMTADDYWTNNEVQTWLDDIAISY